MKDSVEFRDCSRLEGVQPGRKSSWLDSEAEARPFPPVPPIIFNA